jgi:hypothetical protein
MEAYTPVGVIAMSLVEPLLMPLIERLSGVAVGGPSPSSQVVTLIEGLLLDLSSLTS